MNQHLQSILNIIQQDESLSAEEKSGIIKSLKDANKELEITSFKLDRTEKVKRTTAILLEETIDELEQKRKAVEAQNRELEIESALERVRTVAMSMNKPDDMLLVCRIISGQLELLKVKEIRNVQTAIFYEGKGTYINYEFYTKHDKTVITEVDYKNHSVQSGFANQMLKGPNEMYSHSFKGMEVKEWLEFQKTTNVFIDTYLEIANSLNYYWYSLGPVALGISTYNPLTEEENKLFKRFLKVFELAYRRYLDIERALGQAKEARIETSLERVRAVAMAMKKSEEVINVCEVMYKELLDLGFTNIRNAQIALKNQSKQSYLICAYSDKEVVTLQEAPYNSSPIVKDLYDELQKSKDAFYEREFSGKQFEEWRKWRESLYPLSDNRGVLATSMCFYLYSIGTGHIGISTFNAITNDQVEILKRFKNVFELSYQRYTDVAKAEAQAMEARIEAALEKVRSRSLAVHHSDEFKEVIQVVFEKLQELEIQASSVSINIFIEGSKDTEAYVCGQNGGKLSVSHFRLVYVNHPISNDRFKARQSGLDFFSKNYSVEEKNSFFEYLFEVSDLKYVPDDIRQMVFQGKSYTTSLALAKNSMIVINDFEGGFLSEKEVDIIKRFSKVFEQAYIRFLDLQKAEAQAREATIEAALERTRTQSMLMQHSKELDDTLRVFHEQVHLLGINSAFSFLWLPDEDKGRHIFWAAWAENIAAREMIKKGSTVFRSKATNYPLDRNEPATSQCLLDWKSDEPIVSYHVAPAEVESYFAAWQELIAGVEQLKPEYFRGGLYYVEAFMKYGCFGVMIENELSKEEKAILGRLAIEFERAYTRFLDLQKAEAQAREAIIEAALEKIRSRSLAMHKSDELKDVVVMVVEKMKELNIETGGGLSIVTYTPGSNDLLHWYVNADHTSETHTMNLPYFDDLVFNECVEAREKGMELFTRVYSFEEKNKYFEYAFEHSDYGLVPEEFKKWILEQPCFGFSYAIQKHSGIFLSAYTGKLFSKESNDILIRISRVFEQAYVRFLDLQKAEAQSREAKIEAAMEKVRSRALAMQKPDELVEVAQLLRREMNVLGVEELETSSIYIHHEDTGKTECWYAIKDVEHPEKELVSDHMNMDLNETWVGKQMLAFYRSNEKRFSIKMQGTERKEWINYCAAHSKVLVGFYGDNIPDRTYHLHKFSNGYIGAASPGEISTESWDLLQRATSVFSLAYTRFNDLQQAAAQAREAKIEAALERVRSRTLAMQKSDELSETAAVLFKQLILLGIEPNRLYINIIKDEKGTSEFWITDEDGSKVSSAFESNMNDNKSFKKMYKGWKEKKKSLMIDMKGEELAAYFQHLESLHVPFKNGLMQKRRLQYIAYFNKGFIGMASPDEQPEETVFLLERFAAVFNLTFTRFNDLKIAEAHAIQAREDLIKLQTEKRRAEDALTELKETQKQLIQSEKMASLGELTAGIAHEIQNPLNFVNNFSEVSKELLDEMKMALQNGNENDAKEIADDVIQNLEKINHHGKRADAIVKGMLQHSRSGTGQKEAININALCDEYIRLCYHGLRAKDNSFNAAIKTDFDKTLQEINIIPQDIGRVLLNVLTNAFYAVNEKNKSLSGLQDLKDSYSYKPTVSIQTKEVKGKSDSYRIEIRVEDNGNGIPKNIIDKIFQPFFTTKPTGQGTGLGLSLAYDIITKEHGGTIKVESKDGEGSAFIIQIPATAL